jgi:hypothetical protein
LFDTVIFIDFRLRGVAGALRDLLSGSSATPFASSIAAAAALD